jgi:hypothetical protein
LSNNKSDQGGKGNYSVGYKKPPIDTRFKPGQSGNAKGRPRKHPTIADITAKELQRRVVASIDGKVEKVPALRAVVMKLISKGLNGDVRAMNMLFAILKSAEGDSNNSLLELLEQFRKAHDSRLTDGKRARSKSKTDTQDSGDDA